MVLADEKKKNDRLLLDELRKKLLELMQMNQQLPENCRIGRQVDMFSTTIFFSKSLLLEVFFYLFYLKNF